MNETFIYNKQSKATVPSYKLQSGYLYLAAMIRIHFSFKNTLKFDKN